MSEDEHRRENEDDDVEGHRRGALTANEEASGEGEEEDDVEAHRITKQ